MIQIEHCDNYGTYKTRLIAILDWSKIPFKPERGLQMCERSNQPDPNKEFRKFSPMFSLIPIPTETDPEGEWIFAIFVAQEDMNTDWYKNNINCPYVKATNNKVRKFPLASKRAKWDAFLEKYPFMKPVKDFQSMEEVLNFYS